MPKFVFVYHAPTQRTDASPPDAREMRAMIEKWTAWAARVGDGLVDLGTPLSGGVRVTADGTAVSSREVVGYSIIEVEDMDAALALAHGHPHLNAAGGGSIEVHEARTIPGM